MKHLDLTYIRDNVTRDKKFILHLFDLFRSVVKRDGDAMQVAIDEGNFDHVKRLGHKLKSSFRTLGMEELTTLAFDIELGGFNAVDMDEVQTDFNKLKVLIDEVYAELDEYVKANPE